MSEEITITTRVLAISTLRALADAPIRSDKALGRMAAAAQALTAALGEGGFNENAELAMQHGVGFIVGDTLLPEAQDFSPRHYIETRLVQAALALCAAELSKGGKGFPRKRKQAARATQRIYAAIRDLLGPTWPA